MSEKLLREFKQGVLRLTLNRPERRNALDREMILALHECLDQAAGDAEVRVVCLTGAGEKSFCSGGDLGATAAQAGEEESGPELYAGLLKKLSSFPGPTLARVAGPCLAGGLGLMLGCDIAIAKDDVFFCAPEVNVGIFPFMVGALLKRDVGWKKAMDMVLTGRKVGAAEAEAMGLISRAVDPERFEDEVNQTLQSLAAKSPMGMRLGKEAFSRMQDMDLAPALDMLCISLGQAVQTEDAREGMAAFMEKRKPKFTGR